MDLQEFAFADLVGCAADDAGGELGIKAGAEVEAVADEIVAEEDGGLVSAEVVDGGAFAAKLGVVENVIVNEGGHVNHLDYRGEDSVGFGKFAGGFAGEEDE